MSSLSHFEAEMYFSHMLNKQCSSSSSSFEKAEYVTFQIKSLMCKACI